MSNTENYSIHVLFNGYSKVEYNGVTSKDNCTCTLIKGPVNMIIDTMTAWDGDKILEALAKHNLGKNDIHYVVSTHGHSDHIGNNNLFLKAKHIVGYSISQGDLYYIHPFENEVPYIINDNIKIIPTPGHTLSDVSVVFNYGNETYTVAGDLFESANDVQEPNLWLEAGSESPEQQRKNRIKVAQMSDWIIPGHGPMFKCTEEIRTTLESQIVTKCA